MDAICTRMNKKDNVYCQELLEKQIIEITTVYHGKVVGVVTDNESKMELMRTNLQKKYPHLYVYGCNSHLLNLVGVKLTPAELKDRIVKVQSYFRSHTFEGQALKAMSGLRPVLPGDTRWNSQMDCFENYQKNHTKYLDISRMRDASIDTDIMETLVDSTIYDDLTVVLEVLKPIAVALDRVSFNKFAGTDAHGNGYRHS